MLVVCLRLINFLARNTVTGTVDSEKCPLLFGNNQYSIIGLNNLTSLSGDAARGTGTMAQKCPFEGDLWLLFLLYIAKHESFGLHGIRHRDQET